MIKVIMVIVLINNNSNWLYLVNFVMFVVVIEWNIKFRILIGVMLIIIWMIVVIFVERLVIIFLVVIEFWCNLILINED